MPLPIRAAATTTDFAQARALFDEYAAWLAVDLCFQGFAEELATLPGAYAPPCGTPPLAGSPGAAVGCIALRPLAAGRGTGAERDGRSEAPLRHIRGAGQGPGQAPRAER